MYKPSTLPNSRIDAADVLRGFAIAGIILIHFLEHMNFYSFPELTKLDENVWDTIFFLFAGKMYAIFAILFGLSFFIQHDNQAQKGEDFRPRFVWRMVLLMLFGLLDLMFYNGDILFIYAVCGLLIIPFIRCSNKVLNWIILILMIQPIEVIYIVLGLINPETRPLNLGSGMHFMNMMPAQANGTIWDVALVGIKDGLPCNFLWAIENGRFTQNIYLFLVGIMIGRSRLLYNEGNNYKKWQKIMLITFIAFAVFAPLAKFVPGTIENRCVSNSLGVMLNMWRNVAMALFYVTGITWLLHRTKNGKRLMVLAPYGKMSLTHYIGQSIIGAFIFYGWGLALFKTSGHTESLCMAIVFIALQILFSHWWMKNHKRGPLEGLWNKATWIGTNK